MATIKKLYIASGVATTAPADISSESSTVKIQPYADDAAFVTANGTAQEGDIYINTTIEGLRMYSAGAWRSVAMLSDPADATKVWAVDSTGATTGTSATFDFNQTASRIYTFPDVAGIVGLVPSSGPVRSNGSVLSTGDTDLSSEVTGVLPIANGGTGESDANDALNALLPDQTGNSGKYLQTDGTDTSWVTSSGGVSVATPTVSGTVTSYAPVIASAIKATSTSYTILDNDGYNIIAVTTGASTLTITLPAAANNAGRVLQMIKVDSGSGVFYVDAAGSETIDGSTDATLYGCDIQYDSNQFFCNGSAWFSIRPMSINQGVALNGGFTGGDFYTTKTGMSVMGTIRAATWSSATGVSSAAGMIPVEFRPQQTITDIVYMDSTAIWLLYVYADGSIEISIRDWTGTSTAKSSLPVAASVTWLQRN